MKDFIQILKSVYLVMLFNICNLIAVGGLIAPVVVSLALQNNWWLLLYLIEPIIVSICIYMSQHL